MITVKASRRSSCKVVYVMIEEGKYSMKKMRLCVICLGAGLVLGCFAGCSTTGSPDPAVTSSSDVITQESVTDTSGSEPSEETIAATEASEPSQDTEPDSNDEYVYVLEDIDQEYANTFITNFVEVFFYDYDRDTANAERILDFAHIHLKINSRDSISYANKGDLTYETFTLEKARSIAGKYFGILLNDDEVQNLPAPPASFGDQPAGPFYEDGKIWYLAGDGESYNMIGIVNSVTNNGDGTLTIDFTVYSIELETYWQMDNNDFKAYYKMTPAMAEADDTLSAVKTGSAVAGVSQSGEYYLISYKT